MNGSNNPTVANVIQAIRGPIMLITLGALVEIDYLGIYGFSRTWPILIIIFGILKLLEKVAGGSDSYVAPHQPGSTAI